jgi:ethanolamine utilization microcompartment shell protein EutS
MPISFDAKPAQPMFAAVPHLAENVPGEQVDLSGLLKNDVTEIFTRVYAEPRSPYCSLAFPDNLLGGWANPDGRATIDDAGLRGAGGLLKTALGVDFATPAGSAPNCLFLSHWKQDEATAKIGLLGRAAGIYLLMAGSTLPQSSRMQHGTVSVTYKDGTLAKLILRNPETWWPIEQDYLLDDYLFVNSAPLPPRVDLRTGQTRLLDAVSFHGKGRTVPGGAATILHLPLDPAKELASLQVEVDLYGIVVGLIAATLARA